MAMESVATQNRMASPLKVDALQLVFFLLGATHIYGALRAGSAQRKKSTMPAYSYLLPLAAVIAGGVELLLQ